MVESACSQASELIFYYVLPQSEFRLRLGFATERVAVPFPHFLDESYAPA